MKIELDGGEVVTAQMLATMRHHINRACSVRNAKIGKQSDYETDLEGIGAELAFCKKYNYWPDLSIAPRKGGWDVLTRSGKKVDVKVTRYEDGRLLATTGKRMGDSDYYVLMVGKFPVYEVKGYCTETDLLKEENITSLGHGPTYALTQPQLRKLDDPQTTN